MKNLTLIKKKPSKEGREISDLVSSKLLEEFFNGFVIKIDQAYTYDS